MLRIKTVKGDVFEVPGQEDGICPVQFTHNGQLLLALGWGIPEPNGPLHLGKVEPKKPVMFLVVLNEKMIPLVQLVASVERVADPGADPDLVADGRVSELPEELARLIGLDGPAGAGAR